MIDYVPGEALACLRVVPDAGLTARYADASGDHNPIHLDDERARAAGLPGRILHGLYMMALVARAHTDAGGGPASLKRLSVGFRGMGFPEEELEVACEVVSTDGERVSTSATVRQQGKAIIRNAVGELAPSGERIT